MKKLLLFAVALAACGQLINAQDYEWPLAGDLNEIKSTGLNGVDQGDDAITFVQDAGLNKAVAYFDSSAWVKLPSLFAGVNEASVSLWYKLKQRVAWQRLYVFGQGQGTGGSAAVSPYNVFMFIPENADGKIRFTYHTLSGSDSWYDLDVDSTAAYSDTAVWYHSVVTMGLDSMKVYVNGKKVASKVLLSTDKLSDLASDADYQDGDNVLGRSYWDTDPKLRGYLSDLRIYKSVLSETQIDSLYEATLAAATVTGISNTAVKADIANVYVSNRHIIVSLNEGSSSAKVAVYNVSGILVSYKTASEISNLEFIAGVYIVKVTTSTGTSVSKVVIP
jgi:hypothetical protein